ncbi:MAG TPA: FtsH protease activity modulator HflK [Stellaceae bacterium]|nr:FtsH protease activity modulator HflK [Stellaceae bacterium]
MSDRGPWGSGSRGGRGGGGDGSGNGGGPWGSGRGGDGAPRGPGSQPPNFEEMLRRSQDRFRRLLPTGAGGGGIVAIGIAVVVALWLASGFYRVQPDEVGVVLRFGAYNRMTQPGLNYHLPSPIESAMTPKVTRVNRTEIGYRSEDSSGRPISSAQEPEESLMLTGDENIVDVNCTVFWVIKDAKAYLFNIRAPEKTVKSAAESALREVIGEHPLAMELSAGREQIESETHKLLQQLLDDYGSGIEVTQVTLQRVDPPGPVIAAFRDVQAALADQARLKNEAEAYSNGVVPKARGEAAKIAQEAEAYKEKVVAQATGDSGRFDSVYKAFKAAEDVTRARLYIVTMEQILADANKVIIGNGAERPGGVLPYLPLPSLPGFPAGNASTAAPAGGSR